MFTPLGSGTEKVVMPEGRSVPFTLSKMRDLVHMSDYNLEVKALARKITQGIAPSDRSKLAYSIFNWVRDHVSYIADTWNAEELTAPHVLVRELNRGGLKYSSDCDDYSMLIAALMRTVGLRTRFAAVAVGAPGYNHVRPEVFIHNSWVPMEPTNRWRAFSFGFKSDLPPVYQEV